MDALKLLKAEISQKRKQLNDLGVVEPEKKYYKQAEYFEKIEEEGKKLSSDNISESTHSGETSNTSTKASGKSTLKHLTHLPKKEVIRRLRELSEPIRLFGESDEDILKRLKEAESLKGESAKGMRNDLQQALQKVDDDYLKEVIGGDHGEAEKAKSFDVKYVGSELTAVSLEDLAKEAEGKFGKEDSEYNVEFMIRFFKHIIGGWAKELNARPIEVKQSQKGRLDTAIHTQTVEYLKPFLKRLNKKSRYSRQDVLGAELVESIVDIVKYLLAKNYLKAFEAYSLCAVGNATWPIGANNVGIHPRPGREKLSSRNIAHVMNNETHRKFITGVKRLMAQCQKIHPTEPSKSVNFDSHEQK